MPQVCCSPASTDWKLNPPPTGTGVSTDSPPVPIPSCPSMLRPQQYAAPEVVTPQACEAPSDSDAKVCPPATGEGTEVLEVVPFPSVPSPLEPQHQAWPAGVRAQETWFQIGRASCRERV